ncbi:hypothetical protein QN344_06845, partial [Mucilaginibacter sp. 5B2]|nr:hypothetical protein [Mucilaginibacter sp. 5B2]
WKDSKVTKLIIKSVSGGECKIRVANVLKTATPVKGKVQDKGTVYSFKTTPGATYTFTAGK